MAGSIEYNYRREPAWEVAGIGESLSKRGEGPTAEVAAMTGTDVATYTRDRPGVSAFVIEDGAVYHTYSTYVRGLDGLWGMYQWLDRAPRGVTRQAPGFAATTSTTRDLKQKAVDDAKPGRIKRGMADRARRER